MSAGDNCRELEFVVENLAVLREAGMFERAFLAAFTGTRTNNLHWRLDELASLFRCCDRDRLRAAGDPLPGPGPFTLYRGVAGRGARRRLRGFSWTDDVEQARWFATRFQLAHPAVVEITVDESAVLASVNDRQEREFVIGLPPDAAIRRVWPGTIRA
jgi:hypothetical protein